jgi:radial spoke head protein 1
VSHPNGDKYEGVYSNGKRHGNGVYTWKDGKKYEGGYHEHKKHGVGKFSSEEGTYHGIPSINISNFE